MNPSCHVCDQHHDLMYLTGNAFLCGPCRRAGRTRELDLHMRTLIPRLALLSWVSSGFAPTGGQSSEHPGGRQPTGGGMNGHDWWTRYTTARDAQAFVHAAESELEHAHRSTGDRTITESAEELTARIRAKRADGWTIKEVSMFCRCTETRVRQADRDTTVAKVLEMRGKYTVRQIGAMTGLPKSTVQDIIRAEAA